MAAIPYTRLFIGPQKSVVVSGKYVSVLNSTTGEVISSTRDIVDDKAGNIVAAAVNEDYSYLLTVGENKRLKLWELSELKLINERELPKRPTCISFTKDSQTILISDKFGDVFSYSFNYTPFQTPKSRRDDLSSHESPSNGQLVLGHASPVNSFVLSVDENYIITADRDEHIRVSWYPKGHNIEMYCLGHRKYVSAIHLPLFDPKVLISGGGEQMLKHWDWMTGKCLHEVEILNTIEPFILVKSDRRRKGDDGDDEEDGVEKRKGKGKKSKRRGRKNAKAAAKEAEADGEGNGNEKDAEGEDEEQEEGEEQSEAVEEKVLVVNKIASVDKGEAKYVIFNAVGATALFAYRYQQPEVQVEHIDFGHPVIDFTTDSEGRIWVSLDTSRSAPDSGTASDGPLVRVVWIDENGKLVSLGVEDKPLLKYLNETGKITDGANKNLDFYVDLKGLPKWSEPTALAAALTNNKPESVAGSASSKPLTRREEGRLKNKKVVLAKMQELAQSGLSIPGPRSASGESKTGIVRSVEDVEGAEEGRELKRSKTDRDVEMGL